MNRLMWLLFVWILLLLLTDASVPELEPYDEDDIDALFADFEGGGADGDGDDDTTSDDEEATATE